MTSPTLYTRDFRGGVPWAEIDSFLLLRLREAIGIEYREKMDPGGGGLTRFVDTVGAMANSGGGLIFVGVATNKRTDTPESWPMLDVGALKPQTLEAQVRGNIRPFVPIEVASAAEPTGFREVVAVRVPDFWPKPVFVSNSGVLHRQGEANVLASVEQIRTWLSEQGPAADERRNSMAAAAGLLTGNASPIFNIAIGASLVHGSRAWGDATDRELDKLVHDKFNDAGPLTIDERLVQFLSGESELKWSTRVQVDPRGWVVRGSRPPVRQDRLLNALYLAGEIRRTWELALNAVPVVLPGYSGPMDLVLSLGGVTAGFLYRSVRDVHSSPPIARPIAARDEWRGEFRALSPDLGGSDVVHLVMSRVLRAFGYSEIESWVDQLATLSWANESYDDVGPQ